MQKVNDILMFGGECSDLRSGKVYVYNDLYRFSTDKQRWAKITSPNRWAAGGCGRGDGMLWGCTASYVEDGPGPCLCWRLVM